MCPIDRAVGDIAYISKRYYVRVLLKELGLLDTTSGTYQQDLFRFIDDLLSLNDGTFEKHYKDIYPTELTMKKENNNSCASFLLDMYIYIKNGEFHTKLFDKPDNLGYIIVTIPFYCSSIPSKMFYGSIGAEYLRISRATSKIEDLSRTCKQLLSMFKQNGQTRRIKFSLIKMIQRHQEIFIQYNKSIEEHQISNIFYYVHFLHIVYIFIIPVLLTLFIYVLYTLYIFT